MPKMPGSRFRKVESAIGFFILKNNVFSIKFFFINVNSFILISYIILVKLFLKEEVIMPINASELTKEMIEKAMQCKTVEELMKLAAILPSLSWLY